MLTADWTIKVLSQADNTLLTHISLTWFTIEIIRKPALGNAMQPYLELLVKTNIYLKKRVIVYEKQCFSILAGLFFKCFHTIFTYDLHTIHTSYNFKYKPNG